MNPIIHLRRGTATCLAFATLAGSAASATALIAPGDARGATEPDRVLVMTSVTAEKFAYRPHKIVLAPRGIFEVKGISWRHDGPESASATAVVDGRVCKPLCDGPFFKRRAKLRLWEPRRCPGWWAYTYLLVTFKEKAPPGFGHKTRFINMPTDNLGYPNCGVKG